jgi:multicomponent Na+:H+ antiporter subunit C
MAGFLLILFGLWGILTNKNILKIIIGFSLFDTGTHVVIVSISYVKGKTAPIIDETLNIVGASQNITDPVPQALVLTAIVIGLGVTALMLAYAVKMHKEKGTLDIASFKELNG